MDPREDLLRRISNGREFTVEETLAAARSGDRATLVPALIELLETWTPERGPRTGAITAIRALGELRAAEAVPALLRHLLLQPFEPELSSNRVRVAEPPAFAALATIGEPSVGPLLHLLETTEHDADAVAVAVGRVLRRVLGPAEGERCTRERLGQQRGGEAARRLTEALQYFGEKQAR